MTAIEIKMPEFLGFVYQLGEYINQHKEVDWEHATVRVVTDGSMNRLSVLSENAHPLS